MALAQEKAIQAKVSAKKPANSTCSTVTFTGLITSYIFHVPKAVMSAEAPNTKSRASVTSRPLTTGRAPPSQDLRSWTGMSSRASEGVVSFSFVSSDRAMSHLPSCRRV